MHRQVSVTQQKQSLKYAEYKRHTEQEKKKNELLLEAICNWLFCEGVRNTIFINEVFLKTIFIFSQVLQRWASCGVHYYLRLKELPHCISFWELQLARKRTKQFFS